VHQLYGEDRVDRALMGCEAVPRPRLMDRVREEIRPRQGITLFRRMTFGAQRGRSTPGLPAVVDVVMNSAGAMR
jgi:hypothetical protein